MSNLVRCDLKSCGETYPLPTAILTVSMGMVRRIGEPAELHFCGWTCLAQYAADHAVEELPEGQYAPITFTSKSLYPHIYQYEEQPHDQDPGDRRPH